MTEAGAAYRDRAARFFDRYNPEKLPALDELLAEWDFPNAASMEEMFASLVKHFGPEPPGPNAPTAGVEQDGPGPEPDPSPLTVDFNGTLAAHHAAAKIKDNVRKKKKRGHKKETAEERRDRAHRARERSKFKKSVRKSSRRHHHHHGSKTKRMSRKKTFHAALLPTREVSEGLEEARAARTSLGGYHPTGEIGLKADRKFKRALQKIKAMRAVAAGPRAPPPQKRKSGRRKGSHRDGGRWDDDDADGDDLDLIEHQARASARAPQRRSTTRHRHSSRRHGSHREGGRDDGDIDDLERAIANRGGQNNQK